MTPAELVDMVTVMAAQLQELRETAKRLESQSKTVIQMMSETRRYAQTRQAAYRRLTSKYEKVLAQQTVRSELTDLLREFVNPTPEPSQREVEAVKRDYRNKKQHQTRKGTK